MKKHILLLVISMMVATLGFSQILGPPNYTTVDKNEGTPHLKPMKANPPSTTDRYISVSANCEMTGTCVIDYPRPLENPYIKTSSAGSVLLTKAQINMMQIPVVYVNGEYENNDQPGVDYKCEIVDLNSESPATVRSHKRMFCTAVDNGRADY